MNSPLDIALQEYGVKEIVGPKNNPRVVQYSTEIGNTWVRDDEVAWCSEFVNWCLLKSGIAGTKSAVAKSFLKWGKETKTPKLGDLVIFGWADGSGHVGFYINETPNVVRVLGGNQENEVNIQNFKKDRILSYRSVPTNDERAEAVVASSASILKQVFDFLKGK